MNEIEYVTINNINYLILDEIIIDSVKYVFLTNENDPTDILIRKVTVEDNEEYLTAIESKEEIIKAIREFTKKNKQDFE